MVLKYIFSFSLLFWGLFSQAQTKAYLSSQYFIKNVDITVEDFVVTIDTEGNITQFYPKKSDYTVEYYDNDVFDKEKYMKIKVLGDKKIDYYDSYQANSGDFGKLKSIGDIKFEYWNDFKAEKLGKLKSIGTISIDYGDQSYFERAQFNKVIKFGKVSLSYYDNQAFDKQKFGKLKTLKGNSEEISVVVLP